MAGGTYLVARKIRMEIESWDTDPLTDQERIFARNKDTGAPLTGGDEFTAVDYAQDRPTAGEPVVDINAHIRLAAPEQNNGIKLLRRGYNYTDGQDPDTGKLAAGLFFIAFQRDPQAQFKVLQTRLGQVRPAQRVHRAHRRRAVGLPARASSGPGDWFGKALVRLMTMRRCALTESRSTLGRGERARRRIAGRSRRVLSRRCFLPIRPLCSHPMGQKGVMVVTLW